MSDEFTYQDYAAQEPTAVVTVADANEVLQTSTVEIASRLDQLENTVEGLTLVAQDASTAGGVVTIDSAQWDTFAANVERLSNISSATLFLVLVLVCVGSAILGTRLWGELVRGWRHG